MMKRTVLAPATIAVVAAVSAHNVAQGRTFDVASVKLNVSGKTGGDIRFRLGEFLAVNLTLRQLLADAYEIEAYRVVGGPEWIARDRFDVQARAATAVPIPEMKQMLQALLIGRFQLRVRMERQVRPIYALVSNRKDGTLGARLASASPSACVARAPGARQGAGEPPTCGLLPNGPGHATGRSVELDLLAAMLSRSADRVIVNRTGLVGLFDFDLDWSVGGAGGVDLDRKPELPAAIDEQLGLRLESMTAPIDVLLVESAQRPSEN